MVVNCLCCGACIALKVGLRVIISEAHILSRRIPNKGLGWLLSSVIPPNIPGGLRSKIYINHNLIFLDFLKKKILFLFLIEIWGNCVLSAFKSGNNTQHILVDDWRDIPPRVRMETGQVETDGKLIKRAKIHVQPAYHHQLGPKEFHKLKSTQYLCYVPSHPHPGLALQWVQ